MFKITMLVKKKAELSQQEFLAHWASHSAKVLQYQNILRIPTAGRRLPAGHTTAHPSIPLRCHGRIMV